VTNEYERYLEGRDPMVLIRETPARVRRLAEQWAPSAWQQSYAPGKWNAAQIMLLLAQAEVLFGYRAIQALATEDYVVQPMDQDKWMAVSPRSPNGREALQAYVALRAVNLALFENLTPAQRARPFTHPKLGPQNVDLVIAILAGHEVNHLWQLEEIAGVRPRGSQG
jgi:DinB family protein